MYVDKARPPAAADVIKLSAHFAHDGMNQAPNVYIVQMNIQSYEKTIQTRHRTN